MTKLSKDNQIKVGSNYLVERGPKLVTETATEELLANSRTANHYSVGLRDAAGKEIVLGEPMTFLEWGGAETEPEFVYYIYKKTPVDATAEKLPNGEPNPHFVPEHIRNSESDNRTYYDYVWTEVGTRATEEAAVSFAQSKAAD